ncbi:VCBS repeat-containing protein [Urechidicola vernalis]|uniref:VCBS repeat-containing protein n=1 Tax=Urechidicola vernalis TaxID=3075600 RepID=A0ABU2Y7A7_9FLAO|nr:VCBS repeat-containing protein [Urechidicola sp. P050]MDT0553577.1 VCBS repeat-containing protein [Urechidicola sp. P050]
MKNLILSLCTFLFLFSCSVDKKEGDAIFKKIDPAFSGIDFKNNLVENDSLNYLTYAYMYMGGGVSVGDVNNDGLKDLFFTGNMVENKLYLNKGNLKFEDITDAAKIQGDGRWFTGVTMADVNDDGFLDIYCSVGGKFGPKENLLYINNGDLTFSEKAVEYGLADVGNSVQASFFDYDLDGDLDVYLSNYPPTHFNAPNSYYRTKMSDPKDVETDKLFRNDGNKFIDVTDEAGLRTFGLSLSCTIGDLNNDGWPDIYVSNDFSSPDYMFFNNQDGTFSEQVKKTTKHTAFYGMGVDIADYNNDQLLDIIQVDMMAKNNRRQKANMASMNPKLFWGTVNSGFHYQYMQNNLQVNNGILNDNLPDFSDVSRIGGLSSTDWSWGPLFADLDNDGLKDIFISNGTRREINNRDFFIEMQKLKLSKADLLKKSLEIPSEKIDNFVYKNTGDLKFEQVNKEWGIEYPGFSNGVVYADLDNDGDLEIVLNNIDDHATVFQNSSSETSNYITIDFDGIKGNRMGLGNRVYVLTEDETQMQELTLTRGFQSSVAPELHFGLGQSSSINKLKVVWTDGKTQVLENLSINQKLTLKYEDAVSIMEKASTKNKIFSENSAIAFPEHKHVENYYDDFIDQVLLPHKMSHFGPALAIGDLNGDGKDDYFVGGSSNYVGAVYLQENKGFEKKEISDFEQTLLSEDVGATIFDADNDGDNDLYVVSGGYEFEPNSKWLQDRLYINDGNGNLTLSENVLPEMIASGSRVYSEDLNKDGKLDLVVLGRQVPKNYPSPANSYILFNKSENGVVKFENVTDKAINEFTNLGMATSAIITDFNNDSWKDIIVVGEWMPIRVFQNNEGVFTEVSEKMGLTNDSTSWWWSIQEGDFDNDGDMDYIVGNNGLNYKYQATEEETFDIFINDFDKDEKSDIVLSYYNEGEQFPVRGRECSSQQIPAIKTKYKNYESFSEATLVDIYTEQDLKKSVHYQVKSFASIYLENKDGKFIIHKLPNEAQVSSVNQILVDDYNNDGNLDAVLVGNLHVSEIETTRNDASVGQLLIGDGSGNFNAMSATESGLFIPGDVKDAGIISVDESNYIIAVKNEDLVQTIKIN